MSVQIPTAWCSCRSPNEAEAVRVAKKYLSYFQGPLAEGSVPTSAFCAGSSRRSPAHLRRSRRLSRRSPTPARYSNWAPFRTGMVTALVRVEGRPIGVIANNPTHLAGAIDSDGADKAARFMQLCDAFDLPLLFLCDTPGIMVGPEIEKNGAGASCRADVRSSGRTSACRFFTIVLRKGYGLGAQAMAGGSFKTPIFTVSWPTGEFGGMGLEGATKLGYRKELEAIDDPAARKKLYEEMGGADVPAGQGAQQRLAFRARRT